MEDFNTALGIDDSEESEDEYGANPDKQDHFFEDERFYDENDVLIDPNEEPDIEYREDGEYVEGHKLLFPRKICSKSELLLVMADYKLGGSEGKQNAMQYMCEVLSAYTTHILIKHYPTYYKKYPDDMRQECYLGICEGMDDYDPEKGKPTTWFIRFIRHRLQVFTNGLKGSTSHFEMARKKVKRIIELKEAAGVRWTMEDICIESGISPKTIKKILQTDSANNSVSFQANPVLMNKVKDESLQPEDAYLKKEKYERLHSYITGKGCKSSNRLTEDEMTVIYTMFGFDQGKGSGQKESLIQTARILEMKESYVKKCYTNALKKFRQMYREDAPIAKRDDDDIPAHTGKKIDTKTMNAMSDCIASDDDDPIMMFSAS